MATGVITFCDTIPNSEISKIIKANRFVDHSLYVDDLYIMYKKNSNYDWNRILQKDLLDIKNWTKYSGAKISLLKTKDSIFAESTSVIHPHTQ